MCSQSKGIGSAKISASMCGKIRTIPALIHCASHRWDNVKFTRPRRLKLGTTRAYCRRGSGATTGSAADLCSGATGPPAGRARQYPSGP
jgi:hypothetical protein